jgi:hypothetical protein
MKIKILGFISVSMLLLSACSMTQQSDSQNNTNKSTEKSSSKIETSNLSKPNSNVTISDIAYNENFPTIIGKRTENMDISGSPVNSISVIVQDSPEIVQVTILDDGKQINIKDTNSGYITSKARVDKVYKGSLNEGDIINVAEQGGVEQVEKQGETLNIISLPEDNSQPLQSEDKAILFLYDNKEFSQLVGEKIYIRSAIFFSKYVIDPTLNTVQLASLDEYQLSEFNNIAVKTKKMKLKKFKSLNATLEYKEMPLSEFESHLRKK